MTIRKNEEGRRGTYHGAGGVKMYPGDNNYECDNHGNILQDEKNDEWHSDAKIAIVKGMYLRENKHSGTIKGRKMDSTPRTIRTDSTAAMRSWVPTSW